MESATFVQKLVALLVAMKVVKASEGDALENAFKESAKEQFDDFLLDEGLIEKEDLLAALGKLYQVPFIDVVGLFFDSALLHKFPKGMLLRLGVIPYQVDENILLLVASRPDDPRLLSCLGNYVSYDVQFMVGLRTDIDNAIKEYYEKSPTELDIMYSEGEQYDEDTQASFYTADDEDDDLSEC